MKTGLNETDQKRFEKCCEDIIKILIYHFPELKYKYKNEFEGRVETTMYLEMIHIGLINDLDKK